MAFGALTANAQQALSLSTYLGTDVAKYDGQIKNVTATRQVFNGWNTISLPFAMSAQQVSETFGSDCRLEKLVGVENDGFQIKLNFQDCKSEGIKANTPYILHYTGETSNKKIAVENAKIKNGKSSVSFTDVNGTAVTFACAQKQIAAKGLYGILAKDNGEASFVSVNDINTNGFYATRCYIQLSNGTSTILSTNHISANETTSISNVLKGSESADVYNLSGSKIATNLNASGVSSLPSGVYVIKGKKVLVK